ncbi:HET-domain-containing protein [Bimuria novae-zelandiae CBS 107.79]|uniref:HET-domain-containing protein n=1 Tax=Bimuria novae-zelandiae CBS 107.79 TaxID=1447943 RepID=A0A6A5VGJ0_9PLEO|nr:HET-domain-containing protein [Bimuria novae-zelandiae CBS 107.79]
MTCRHHDIHSFDGLRCCLSCGETVFERVSSQDADIPRLQNTPYKYDNLNYSLGQEMRLCVLFPGRVSDDIEMDLVHVNIQIHGNHHPPYEAISYAWATQDGDDALSQTVYCQGGVISVTKTCEAALRCLRRQGRKRHLWVDAVCIDQNNVKERNHQVGFMGTIFANASQVVIYLGSGNEASDRILDYLNDNRDAFTNIRRDRIAGIVKDFLNYRWFDRVWVLQEIALAQLATIIAGKKSARWTLVSISKLLTLCETLSIAPPSALRWLPASQPEHDILTVLHNSRNCSSTDPRDKVFAVLGLAHADFQKGFPIDYSLTVEEVYTQLASNKMLQLFLEYVPHDEPPLSTAAWLQWLCLWLKETKPVIKSNPTTAELESTALSLTQIHARDFRFTIDKRSARLETQSLAAWESRRNEPSPSLFPPLIRVRAHELDVIKNVIGIRSVHQIHHFNNKTLPQTQTLGKRQLCQSCAQHYVAKPICQHTPTIIHTLSEEFTRDMRRVLGDGKTMFQTQRSIGVARADLQAGDGIWALDGADVPFMLRRVDQHYIFLGECFLYRALRHSLCICCGCEMEAWPMLTQIIDIW